jgi:tripartite-type tricarboxylate transporter receptor subunit TctC
MNHATKTCLFACAAAAAAFASPLLGTAGAADFPTKPVLYLVGASPDTVPRLMAEQFTGIWGQQVNVQQLPAAGGVVALQTLANAAPDGYTFLYVTAAYTLNQALRGDMPNPPTSLDPVGQISEIPFVILVNPSLGVTTLPELVDYAKQHPGSLNCGSGGAITTSGLGCEMLKTYAGVDIVHVPYKGVAAAMTDLLAGRVQMTFGLGGDLTYAKDGTLRPIAVTSSKRLPAFPDVPTVEEAGLPKLNYVSSWSGLLVPAGTPADIVAALNKALNEVVESEKFKTAADQFAFAAVSSTPEAFGKLMKDNVEAWKKILPEINVSLQ